MAFRFVIARRPQADVAISGRHLQFVQAAVKMVRTDCVCSGAQGAPCSLAIFAAHILRRKAPKFVIARREAPLALPLGELSPKVTERALQALLNGNSNQGEGCFSLSGGCAASSPKGRAKLRNDKLGG